VFSTPQTEDGLHHLQQKLLVSRIELSGSRRDLLHQRTALGMGLLLRGPGREAGLFQKPSLRNAQDSGDTLQTFRGGSEDLAEFDL
jgi:hypothetical protein